MRFSLSTIWGAGIMTATLIAVFLGKITPAAAASFAGGASVMIAMRQNKETTTVQASTAIVNTTEKPTVKTVIAP